MFFSLFFSQHKQALHFHLHLSSYGGSECTSSQHLDESHQLLEYSKVQLISMFEAPVDPRERSPSQKSINACDTDLPPHSSNKDVLHNVGCQSLTNSEYHENQQGEKLDVGCLKNAEVSDAIELSVVASEALVIHELLKVELDSAAVSVEAVLEASIQVKKARIESLESAHEIINEEVDLSDSLSDLDNSTMRDAFDDVGLPSSIWNSDHSGTTCFDVQDAPVNKNEFARGSQCNSIDMTSRPDILGNGLTLKQFEENLVVTRPVGLPLEDLSCNIQHQLSNDDVFGSTSPSYCKYDSMLQHPTQNESDEFVMKQVKVQKRTLLS